MGEPSESEENDENNEPSEGEEDMGGPHGDDHEFDMGVGGNTHRNNKQFPRGNRNHHVNNWGWNRNGRRSAKDQPPVAPGGNHTEPSEDEEDMGDPHGDDHEFNMGVGGNTHRYNKQFPRGNRNHHVNNWGWNRNGRRSANRPPDAPGGSEGSGGM